MMKAYTFKNLMKVLEHYNAEMTPENQKLFFAQLGRLDTIDNLDYSLYLDPWHSFLYIELQTADGEPLATADEPSEIIAYLNHTDITTDFNNMDFYHFLQEEPEPIAPDDGDLLDASFINRARH